MPDKHLSWNAGMKILIVDDSKTIQHVLSKMLHDIGYENILKASNVKEAKTHLLGDEVDLVISDLNMPNESGLEFLEYVRNSDEFKELPFIILTSDNDRRNIIKALKIGVTSYLVKPLKKNIIVDKLTEIALRYQLQTPLSGKGIATIHDDDIPTSSAIRIPPNKQRLVKGKAMEFVRDKIAKEAFQLWLVKDILDKGPGKNQQALDDFCNTIMLTVDKALARMLKELE